MTRIAALNECLQQLPFVRSLGITLTGEDDDVLTAEMPFDPAFSTPPGLFPASVIGVIGDVAAITACMARAPDGHAIATLDFTIKMLAPARGSHLRASGRAITIGKTVATGAADIWVIADIGPVHCATLLATGRVHRIAR